MSSLLAKLFHFVLLMTKKYYIDESHGLSHSMNILHYAHNIYNDEIHKVPNLQQHEKLIYVTAILHDMCDKKYVDENKGIIEITDFLKETNQMTPTEIAVSKKIIQTMSYSTVKKYGFPQLDEYQTAYHIVREADLLTAYDFDRCMIYDMYKKDGDIHLAYDHAADLFQHRVFNHEKDGLLLTDYSRSQHHILMQQASKRMQFWKTVLNNKTVL